jgi:hypothetical protein
LNFEKSVRVFCVLAVIAKVSILPDAHKMVSTHFLEKIGVDIVGSIDQQFFILSFRISFTGLMLDHFTVLDDIFLQ